MSESSVHIATPLRIGFLIHAGARIFTNGITQNAYYMYKCFAALGYTCDFLCQESSGSVVEYFNIPIHNINDATFDPSIYAAIIGITRRPSSVLRRLCKEHNIPIIGFVCGNSYPEDLIQFTEGVKPSNSTSFLRPEDCGNEMWLIPSLEYCKDYFEVFGRCVSYIVPHLWSPISIQHSVVNMYKRTERDLFYDVSKHTGPNHKLDILILEPNISIVKTAVLPIAACEYITRIHPNLIGEIYVFNYPENTTAHGCIDALDIVSRIRKFKRLSIPEIMLHFNNKASIPIIVSHQLLTHLNYVYYEALHYGWPLVHNSDMLDGAGYRYRDHDVAGCASAILSAAKHATQFVKYTQTAKRVLRRVNPDEPAVQMKFDTVFKGALERYARSATQTDS